jgi:glyoxylase-like metal-dependent hydrolase (beta-lactamase superfamily II)
MRHKDAALPEPIEDLRDGETVHGDGVTLVPVYTPGHASDHLCYYLVEERALFTGDVILGGSTTVIPADDGDLLAYLDSLRRLLALDVRRIYPAHGPVIEDGPARITEYLEHRMLRERQILAALADGVETIPAIVARIYVEVAPALHPVAALSVESHLKKLAREGRAHEEKQRDRPSRWTPVR